MAVTSSSFPWGSDASDKVTIEWDPAVKSQPIKVYTTANATGSSRVMNIVVNPNHAGDSAVIEIAQPGEDPIVSTTYGPLQFRGWSVSNNGSLVESGYEFPAGACNLVFTCEAYKVRTDTYKSGKVVTSEVLAVGDTFYFVGVLGVQGSFQRNFEENMSAITAEGANTTFSQTISSLGTSEIPAISSISLLIGISTSSYEGAITQIIGSPVTLVSNISIEANTRVSVSNVSRVSWSASVLDGASGSSSSSNYAHFTGVITYTSGASTASAVFLPVNFTIALQTTANWLSITSQNPNYSATQSQVSLRTLSANSASIQRLGYLRAYPSFMTSSDAIDQLPVYQNPVNDTIQITIYNRVTQSAIDVYIGNQSTGSIPSGSNRTITFSQSDTVHIYFATSFNLLIDGQIVLSGGDAPLSQADVLNYYGRSISSSVSYPVSTGDIFNHAAEYDNKFSVGALLVV